MARPTTTTKKGRVHKGAAGGAGKPAGEVTLAFQASVQEPGQDSRGYYLGRSVRLGGRKVQMAVSELPKTLRDAIPEEWHNEPVRGSVNLYINIPDAEREESFRFKAE